MAVKKPYPRSTLRKLVKAHANRNLSKNADVLIFLDYTLFMRDVMTGACVQQGKVKKGKITAEDIKKATETSLMRFKC